MHAVEEDEREVVVGNRVDHLNLVSTFIICYQRLVQYTYIHEANDVMGVIPKISALKTKKLLEEENRIV